MDTLNRVGMQRIAVPVAIVLIVVAVVVGSSLALDDGCPDGSVLHLPAGTCILPDQLVITSREPDKVEAAVAIYGGQILVTTLNSYYSVRFPVERLAELDSVKDKLAEAGLNVQYAVVGGLFEDR
jgi:hypothetical protein